VTGSNTGVGKTEVTVAMISALRSHAHRIGAYKPVASGCGNPDLPEGDPARLASALGGGFPRSRICPQQFEHPLAPPLAAARVGQSVDQRRLWEGAENWSEQCDFLFVEGAGGLLSPLTWNTTNADLALRLGYPLIVVVDNALGAVNQSLLACGMAGRLGLAVSLLVLCDVQNHPFASRTFVEHAELIDSCWPGVNSAARDGHPCPRLPAIAHFPFHPRVPGR
jgi:dethiobiotin synthetase